MNNQDADGLKELHKQKRLMLLCVLFFGLGMVVGITSGEFLMTLICAAFVIGGILGYILLSRLASETFPDYVPHKGFWYYRKTREQKLQYLTYAEVFIGIVIVISLLNIDYAVRSLGYGVAGIVAIEVLIKRRIKLHEKIDDASLFELEEKGIIKSKDIVKGLYKDFQSWADVRKGNKLLVLTLDNLVIINIEDENNGTRIDCPLRDIRKFGMTGRGKYGEGLLLCIGTRDNRCYRIKLEGSSFQDSPEEFMAQFLKALDSALESKNVIGRPVLNTVEQKAASPISEKPIMSNATFKFRQLDLNDLQKDAAKKEADGAKRYLDL